MDAAAAALRISAHKSHKTSPWDDDLVERLKLLWADGVSASAIALEFGRGITRNAIIGKVHRLGFTNRAERRANSMPRPARPQKFKPLRREFSDWKPFIAPAISDLDIPLGQRKSFMELAPGDCRWGVGDVGSPGFFFCGAPQAPGLPYCHAHRARAYNGKGRVFRPRDFIFKHSRLQILREDAARSSAAKRTSTAPWTSSPRLGGPGLCISHGH